MKLDVYLESFSEPIGILETDETDAPRFSYAPVYLEQGRHPLSVSLPLTPQPFDPHATRAFFANLLPEGQALEDLAARHSVDTNDLAALLQYAGAECAGAVSVVPRGAPPPKRPGRAEDYVRLSEAELADDVGRLSRNETPRHQDLQDISLAGVQRKTAIYVDMDNAIYRAKHGAPTTDILKVEDLRLDDHVDNELFCLGIAKALGLRTVDAKAHKAGGVRYIVVRRYDRAISLDASGLSIQRLHQEDLAQALSLFPTRLKYSHHGGPSAEALFALATHMASPVTFKRDLLRAIILNFLLGNSDAHAKNFSILYDANGPRLAPLYDLTCTLYYTRFRQGMALAVGGQQEYEAIGHDAWRTFAQNAGLGERYVVEQIEQLALAILPAARVTGTTLALSGRVIDRMMSAIGHQVALLNSALGFNVPVDTPPFVTQLGGWPGLS